MDCVFACIKVDINVRVCEREKEIDNIKKRIQKVSNNIFNKNKGRENNK